MKYHWSKEIWPPSSKECNPSDHFMWSEVEREVSKHPHNTLASLRFKVSEEMADLDREVIIPFTRSSGLGLRLLWMPVGTSLNKLCM
jgi:hypothetical protein